MIRKKIIKYMYTSVALWSCVALSEPGLNKFRVAAMWNIKKNPWTAS